MLKHQQQAQPGWDAANTEPRISEHPKISQGGLRDTFLHLLGTGHPVGRCSREGEEQAAEHSPRPRTLPSSIDLPAVAASIILLGFNYLAIMNSLATRL